MSIGIIPAPGDTDGFLELGATAHGALFKKHILTLNKTFVHPKTGKPLTLGEPFWSQLKANFDRGVSMVQVPLVGPDNKHTESPLANTGEVVGLERDGDKIVALLDIRDPQVASKLGKTLLGASAMLSLDYTDTSTGQKVGPALLHTAITNRPHLVDLEPYEPVVAASGVTLSTGEYLPPVEVLMLCASEVDPAEVLLAGDSGPDYAEPDYRDYGGSLAMTGYDQRDEIDRYGMEAARLSETNGGQGPVSGTAARRNRAVTGAPVGSKPAYDHTLIAARGDAALSAADITEDDCLGAALALSARTGGRASANDILAAARELAFERDEQTANETAALAWGLAELSGKLGGDDDPVMLALTAEAEIGRLSEEHGDVISLASGSGGQDSADGVISRHPELAHLFRAGKTSSRRHPRRSDRMVTTRTRAHSSDLEPDTRDARQPARGGQTHPEVERLMRENGSLLGISSNTTYAPKSGAQREAEESHARAGHQPGEYSIPDLDRGSRRTLGGA